MITRDHEDACESCAQLLPHAVDEAGAREVEAVFYDSDGVTDGETAMVCRECLEAGAGTTDGPGWVEVAS